MCVCVCEGSGGVCMWGVVNAVCIDELKDINRVNGHVVYCVCTCIFLLRWNLPTLVVHDRYEGNKG